MKKTKKRNQTRVDPKPKSRKQTISSQPHNQKSKPSTEKRMTPTEINSQTIAPAIVEITPELAEHYLTHNDSNRPLSKRDMVSYQRAMEAGHWQLNGQPIILDTEDHLLDGQHRLNACILAKKPFRTLLIRGISKEAFKSLDSGRRRNASDALAIDHEENTKSLAAALKHIWQHEQGLIGKSVLAPQPWELMETLDRHAGVREFASPAFFKKIPGPASLIAAMGYLFHQADPQRAPDFFEQLRDGYGLKKGSPILLLRDRLRDKSDHRTMQENTGLMIKAWNAWIAGRTLDRLLIRLKGKAAEEIQPIYGLDCPLPEPEEKVAVVGGHEPPFSFDIPT